MKSSSPICTEQESRHLVSLYEAFALIGKSLASRFRLILLELICQSPKTVQLLSEMSGLSIASTSQHLQKLAAAGLVIGTRKGKHVEYAITGVEVEQLLCSLRTVAEQRNAHASNAARTLNDLSKAEKLTHVELKNRLQSGEVILIDVRPTNEYEAGHIADAISIPLDELNSRIKSLKKRKTIVAYCSGPYCFTSRRAVEQLNDHGFRAAVLQGGFQIWKQSTRDGN